VSGTHRFGDMAMAGGGNPRFPERCVSARGFLLGGERPFPGVVNLVARIMKCSISPPLKGSARRMRIFRWPARVAEIV